LISEDIIFMNLNVRLYGNLSRSFENYDSAGGLIIELPEGASVNDLLVHLNISRSRAGMVLIGDRLVKKDEKLCEGAGVRIFQPLFGG